MSRRKRSILIAAGVTLVFAVSALAWWLHWRDLPDQKVPRLLHELRDKPGRMEFSLRSLNARSPEAIHADLDKLGANAVPALIDALADVGEELPTVRNLAAEQLGKLRDPRAVEPLIKCLQERPVRVHYAFRALAEIKDPRAVEPLIVCLKDGDYSVRCDAARALAAIGDKRAFDPLVKVLDDEEIKNQERQKHAIAEGAGLRAAAAAALGRFGDARAFDVLLRILEDEEDPEVRAGAAQALGQLGDRRAIPALTKAAESPAQPVQGQRTLAWDTLKREAKFALETLNRK
jgi:HEAT repeat protein